MLIDNVPKIYAHISSLNKNTFVLPNCIISNNKNDILKFSRTCPHRGYKIGNPGEQNNNIKCILHGFEFDCEGKPINNENELKSQQTLSVGKSGLIFENFKEPDHWWVDTICNEKELIYERSYQGNSVGSWLWMMEIQADLLHVQKNGIHPVLSELVDLDNVKMENGDNWILQSFDGGFWLFIYPYTFVEWAPGCLGINYTIPNDKQQEFGFSWITQFYYNKNISEQKKKEFELLEPVFKEDVEAVEKQIIPYFPLKKALNRLEEHCVHFGQWFKNNVIS